MTQPAADAAVWAAAYAGGATLQQLAADAGRDPRTIARALIDAGVKLRRTGPRGYSEITPEQVEELMGDVGSARAVAALLGVSRTVVRSRLAQVGLAADPHAHRSSDPATG